MTHWPRDYATCLSLQNNKVLILLSYLSVVLDYLFHKLTLFRLQLLLSRQVLTAEFFNVDVPIIVQITSLEQLLNDLSTVVLIDVLFLQENEHLFFANLTITT